MSNTETQQTRETNKEDLKTKEILNALEGFKDEEVILKEKAKSQEKKKIKSQEEKYNQEAYTGPGSNFVEEFIQQKDKTDLFLEGVGLDNNNLGDIFTYLEQKGCLDRVTTLNIANNNLTNLPTLPESLEYLECRLNKLTDLPKLPDKLIALFCNYNKLTKLPNLPTHLRQLYCNDNNLTNLPNLPQSLEYLDCHYNKLTDLPTLPESIKGLNCSNNFLTEKDFPTIPKSLKRFSYFGNYITGEIGEGKRKNEGGYFSDERYKWAIDMDGGAGSGTCAYLNTCIMEQVNTKNIKYGGFFHTPEGTKEEYSLFFKSILSQSVKKSPQSEKEPLKILFTGFPAFAIVNDNPTARYLFNDNSNSGGWGLQDGSRGILQDVLTDMKASDISYNSKEKYIEATIEKVKVQIYTAKLPVDADIDTSNVGINNLSGDGVKDTLIDTITQTKADIVVGLGIEYGSNKFILEANPSPSEVPKKVNLGFLDLFDVQIP